MTPDPANRGTPGENPPPVEFIRLDPAAFPPERMTGGAAGFDIRACLPAPVGIPPGERALVPTGLALAIPAGWEGQVRPRSGLALKNGLTLANSPGTIDSDYRGPFGVILINLGREPFTVHHGDRIAQLVIAPAPLVRMVEVESLDETARGDGGFGHTGRA